MATHRAILGVLQTLKDRLDLRLPALTGGNPKGAFSTMASDSASGTTWAGEFTRNGLRTRSSDISTPWVSYLVASRFRLISLPFCLSMCGM